MEMSGYFWSLRTFSALNTKSSIRQADGWLPGECDSPPNGTVIRGRSIARQVNSFVLFL